MTFLVVFAALLISGCSEEQTQTTVDTQNAPAPVEEQAPVEGLGESTLDENFDLGTHKASVGAVESMLEFYE